MTVCPVAPPTGHRPHIRLLLALRRVPAARGNVTKAIVLFFALIALIQFIRPLGWPGLTRRKDAWKLVIAGFVLSVVVVGWSLTR